MNKTILSLALTSVLFASNLGAVVAPVNVPDTSMTGLLVGIGAVAVFSVCRIFRRK